MLVSCSSLRNGTPASPPGQGLSHDHGNAVNIVEREALVERQAQNSWCEALRHRHGLRVDVRKTREWRIEIASCVNHFLAESVSHFEQLALGVEDDGEISVVPGYLSRDLPRDDPGRSQ